MEDKPYNRFGSIAPLEHEYYCAIWQLVKLGESEKLEGKRKILGQLMLEHPEYQYFWEVPYAFAETELEQAFEQEGVNPDLHLTLEQIICEQIEKEEPPEAAKAYKALLRAGVDQHESRHAIGRVLTGVIWQISHMAQRQKPDEDIYIRELRRLAKHPLKVLKQQMKEDQQGGQSMKVPSDEEWKRQLTECEKAFRKALAMPNKTIVEVLIQGAELVNAVGAKAIFLLGELTMPEKGVVYEDEVEARAAIETFRQACYKVLSSFDVALESLGKLRG